MKTVNLLLVSLAVTGVSWAQAVPLRPLPIIDVHVHAMKVNSNFASEMCPWFLKDMPGAIRTNRRPAFSIPTVWSH